MSSFNYEKALSLDWNGQLFVLTIRGETPLAYNYLYSYDGTNWTTSKDLSNSTVLVNKNPYNVKWTGSNYTIMGNLSTASGSTLLRSSDGIKYSALTTTNLTDPIYDLETNLEFPHTITFPRNMTLALGGAPADTTKIAYSLDEGITWTPSSNSAAVFTSTANNAVWNGKIWLAVGAGGNTIATSADANYWVGRGSYIFTTAGYGVAWSREQTQWVACGTGTNTLAYSPDGVFWTPVNNSSSLLSTAFDVQWNGTIWLAAGIPVSGNKSIAYSYDGRSWSLPTQTNLFDVSGIKLTWNGGVWTAIGRSTSNNNYFNVATSIDGIIWKPYNNPNISSSTLTNIYTNQKTNKTLITSNSSPPLAPTGLTTSSSTINSITYTFTASSGATSYTATAVPTSGNTVIQTGITSSPATITGLQSGMSYTITMVAINNIGSSNSSGSIAYSTLLSAPTSLTATSSSSTSISFSFTPPTGTITSFTATAVPTSGSTITQTGISGSATSTTVSGLQNGMQYTITLVAINSSGSSAASTSVVYQTILGSPTGLTASSTTSTTIVFTFTPPTKGTVTSYTATAVPSSGTTVFKTGITSSPATITGLQSGMSYTITMVAINSYGTSVSSSSLVYSTLLSAPTSLTATSSTTTTISFSFTPPTGTITSFTATAVPTSGSTITQTGISGSATSTTVSGLQNGMQYTITLVAINSSGSSAASTSVVYQTTQNPSLNGNLASNLSVAYSMRLIVSTYTGPVFNAKRTSDGAFSDFYTDNVQSYLTTGIGGTGTSFSSWIGGTVYLIKWYDQSTNANHATNTNGNTTNPRIVLQSGKYVIQDLSGTTKLAITTSIKPYTIFTQFTNSNNQEGTLLGYDNADGGQRLGHYTIGVAGTAGSRIMGDGAAPADWYSTCTSNNFSNGLAYNNGTLATSSNPYTLLTTTTPQWNVLSLSVNSNSNISSNFKYIAYDVNEPRGMIGYMVEMICHSTTKNSASDMQYYYNNRLF